MQRLSTWKTQDSGPQTACKQHTLTLMMMAWLSKAWLSATVMGRLCSTPSHLRTEELLTACLQHACRALCASVLLPCHKSVTDRRYCFAICESLLCKQKGLIEALSGVMQTHMEAQKLGTATAPLIRQTRPSA